MERYASWAAALAGDLGPGWSKGDRVHTRGIIQAGTVLAEPRRVLLPDGRGPWCADILFDGCSARGLHLCSGLSKASILGGPRLPCPSCAPGHLLRSGDSGWYVCRSCNELFSPEEYARIPRPLVEEVPDGAR